MTKTMYQALKRHIMKEREQKKQGMDFTEQNVIFDIAPDKAFFFFFTRAESSE